MMATLTGNGQQQAVPGDGGRIGLPGAVHGSVSAYCASHLPGQVSVVAACSSSPDPGKLDPAGTRVSQPGRLTAVVRR